ncbi:MAG TPA: DUF6157 family protein [Actinomycetota bacterium]|nr:DUF6157 family protein [Actinomycetota bacterium]
MGRAHAEGLNYYDTLIAVAGDCPVTASVVPPSRAKKTVAELQYEMLVDSPFVHTQEDVLFETWLRRQGDEIGAGDVARLRAEFLSKPQACLRASPLPKRYGWGLLFDDGGRVALCPMESERYRDLVASGEVTVLEALRSTRR